MSVTKPLQPLKDRQKEILIHIYRFRFLNRPQIQALLHHKQFNRINIWLNELTENNYLKRYYLKTTASQAAVYSLGTNGRKYLKTANIETIKLDLLDRVWREKNASFQFKNHCQFLAQIFLSLSSLVEMNQAKLAFYTKTDLNGMKYLILPHPDAYFSLEEINGAIKRYFLEIIDEYSSNDKLVQLVLRYFSYYSKHYWQNYAKKPFPEIIIISPDLKSKKCLSAVIRQKLKKEPNIRFYLAMKQETIKVGLTREVLELVKPTISHRQFSKLTVTD